MMTSPPRIPADHRYEVIGLFDISEILPLVVLPWKKGVHTDQCYHRFSGLDGKVHRTRTTSDSLTVFKTKGTKCISCGVKGLFFSLEKRKGGHEDPRIKLYAISSDGTWVRITKRRIVPKNQGGQDSLCHYQPMCQNCNRAKDYRTSTKMRKATMGKR